MVKRLSLLFVTAALAACQPLPQPFQADSRTKASSVLVRPVGETSIFVAPVSGLPAGQDAALALALADALEANELPASATARSVLSSVLTVRLEPQGGETLWQWSERQRDGTLQGEPAQPLGLASARLAGGDAGAIKQAAATMAAAIAARLNAATTNLQADTAPIRLALQECDGAPGDGNRSLRQALREILILAGQPPVADPATADYRVACSVRVWADGPDSERVTIEWALLGRDGSRLGEVKQANRIPRGQLAQAWGTTAHIVAQGGWQGLSRILEDRRRAGPALPPTKS